MHPSTELTYPSNVEVTVSSKPISYWPVYKRIVFRFFCLFFLIFTEPWLWILDNSVGTFLGFGPLMESYRSLWLIPSQWVSTYLLGSDVSFDKSMLMTGSGDTFLNWVQYLFCLLFACTGTIIWTILDSKRVEYEKLFGWLRVVVRYYLALIMAIYGLIKVFHLQMPVPSLSQLSTPLGEFTPMRLAWLFIGHSSVYEFFAGFMELLGGFLLLFRRTTMLGACILAGVLTNVFLLNIGYDIPVKLFSGTLLLMTLFLLAYDAERLWKFFVLNQPVASANLVPYNLGKIDPLFRVLLKIAFILIFFAVPAYENYQTFLNGGVYGPNNGVLSGIYQVEEFRKNNHPLSESDTLMWRNVVFERSASGSIAYGTVNSPLLRYGRDYFTYQPDTIQRSMAVHFRNDTTRNFVLYYTQATDSRLILQGKMQKDSLYIVLHKKANPDRLETHPIHLVSPRPW